MLLELFIQDVSVKSLVIIAGYLFFHPLFTESFVKLMISFANGFVKFGDLRFCLQDGVRFFSRYIKGRAQTEWVGRQ